MIYLQKKRFLPEDFAFRIDATRDLFEAAIGDVINRFWTFLSLEKRKKENLISQKKLKIEFRRKKKIFFEIY